MKIFNKINFFLDFVSVFLIFATHFFNFILYHEYFILFPEIFFILCIISLLSIVVALALAIPSQILRALIYAHLVAIIFGDVIFGLGASLSPSRVLAAIIIFPISLAIALFLREHTNKVLIAVFFTMLVSSFVLKQSETAPVDQTRLTSDRKEKTGLPTTVHLVLDEHTGFPEIMDNLPGGTGLREELTAFYLNYGFKVFTNAYSEYFNSPQSLAAAMNFDELRDPSNFLVDRTSQWIMDRDHYLSLMLERGYGVEIYQSSYIDFCAELLKVERCTTYAYDRLDESTVAGLPAWERMDLIWKLYYSSFAVSKLLVWLQETYTEMLLAQGIGWPGPDLWHGRLGPFAVTATFDQLIADVSEAREGSFFFAHLLTPHHPYVYDARCGVRLPVSDWQMRHREDGSNNADSRRDRYQDYFEQMRCTARNVERLFQGLKRAGLFDNAVIVVHGDHGSRITLLDPVGPLVEGLTIEAEFDGFSTLFALKAPWVNPGIDDRPFPLSVLLEFTAERGKFGLPDVKRPYIYIKGNGDGYLRHYIRFPFANTSGS